MPGVRSVRRRAAARAPLPRSHHRTAPVVGITLVAGLVLGSALPVDGDPPPRIPLASEGAAHSWALGETAGNAGNAVTTGGSTDAAVVGRDVAVPTGTSPTFLPGTRVIDPGAGADPRVVAAAHEEAQRQRAWVAAGRIPGTATATAAAATTTTAAAADTPHAALARAAMLDLYVATHTPDGAVHPPLAAPTGAWRYVWPRDAAFVAVALARTGHAGDAVQVLEFFGDVPVTPTGYHARYRPDGSPVGDGRSAQLDGAGWLLWASGEVVASLDDGDDDGDGDGEDGLTTQDALTRLADVVGTSGDLLLAATDRPGHLPPPSSDYWELRETRLTLGTATPVLAGLAALGDLREFAGHDGDATAARERHARVRTAVVDAFGPRWPREVGGRERDAALAFALPPFQDEALPGAEAAWRLIARGMARPAGGLAPGEGWREPGHSWTPQTTLDALAAAATGDPPRAEQRLDWLARHTTATGSIPEKVTPDGAAAQVAPLVWSSALVVLTLDELARAQELDGARPAPAVAPPAPDAADAPR
ncbi:glycoside hydrolase family 15 [Litorihabitans aurantiacus]|uniref:Glycoside hydrolase family 15 n=1 Tax=Litorihabitans aurantiacus TaxID=1930061 RepID=A0AA37ULR8_9MICO|nr:glycoside hydrolase family 15 [Litorihabitans aurantiacus]GMA30349.1 hypothetical protein GCM10025875_03410 [Litorihabitans aurantiacus]